MVFQDVGFAFGAWFVNFFAILAVVISGSFQNWKIQFRYRFRPNIGMPFCKMIDQHTSSFKTQQTCMTFVNKSMIICWWNLKINQIKKIEQWKLRQTLKWQSKRPSKTKPYFRYKFLWGWSFWIFGINFCFSIRSMHSLHVFF